MVINNGDHDVIDLELNFGFHFCDTPPTRTSRRVHGYFEADISPTPFLILASINRRIIAPAILPNKSFAFFLVNATGYIVTVDYPSTALGLVSGESTKRLIELIPPNEMGAVKHVNWPLFPSSFEWLGLPKVPQLSPDGAGMAAPIEQAPHKP